MPATRGRPRYVVLPDLPFGPGPRQETFEAPCRVDHPSGRPWIVGHWADEDVVASPPGADRLVLFGESGATADQLAGVLRRCRTVTDLDTFARTAPGSFGLVARIAGAQRVQGSAGGLVRVHRADVDGVTVVGDPADELVRLVAARVNRRTLALRLLDVVPHPVAEHPIWDGVDPVEPGWALEGDCFTGRLRPRRWWTPPAPVLGAQEGAAAVREALTTAVALRTRRAATVSCDLSGGLDSTAVTFLAARTAGRLTAVTMPSRDPGDDDLDWARTAAAALPSVEHLVLPVDEIPLFHDGLGSPVPPVDEPAPTLLDLDRQLAGTGRLLAAGSGVHLTGMGGDHLLWGTPAHLADLIVRHPLPALRRLAGYRLQYRWPLRATITAVTDRTGYARWLRGAASSLGGPSTAPGRDPVLGWDLPPSLPPWATREAVDLVLETLLEAADGASPLSDRRGVHAELAGLRHGTRVVRVLQAASATRGLPMASPFLDDRVVEACLSVDPLHRVTPWAYKPLLKAAMAGLVPEPSLRRETKGMAARDEIDGLRRHRSAIVEAVASSPLVTLGLVDLAAFTDAVARPSAPEFRPAALDVTLACAVWLNSHDAPVPSAP